jgi:Tfp pilus assembly protein FimT
MSAFTVLVIKALMMIGVIPSQAKKANAGDEVARLLIDNVRLANDLSLARAEARAVRDELARLTEASHRCQHQAQLNRAAQNAAQRQDADMLAFLQAQQAQAVAINSMNMLGQINALNFGDCARMLNDCGMHRAEQMTRQMPAPPTPVAWLPPEPAEIAAPTRALRVTLVSHRRAGKSAVERALARLPVAHD